MLNKQFGLFIVIGLFFCIGLAYMQEQVREGLEGRERLPAMQFAQNVIAMYGNNKITANAAVTILKDYTKTLTEDTPNIQRIRVAVGEELPDMTDAERMKVIKDEIIAMQEHKPETVNPDQGTEPNPEPKPTEPPKIVAPPVAPPVAASPVEPFWTAYKSQM